jgi:replication-associated recombination protein RarA
VHAVEVTHGNRRAAVRRGQPSEIVVSPVPLKIRNAPTKLMKDLKYGKGYKAYDEESYLPDKLKNKKYLKGEK